MIDTETAISCVDITIQNTFRHLAHNKMKQQLQCNSSHYILYKRQVYVQKQFCNKLQKHYLLYMLTKQKRQPSFTVINIIKQSIISSYKTNCIFYPKTQQTFTIIRFNKLSNKTTYIQINLELYTSYKSTPPHHNSERNLKSIKMIPHSTGSKHQLTCLQISKISS